jgi:N6-adenosine-specific RNA methylase IME4
MGNVQTEIDLGITKLSRANARPTPDLPVGVWDVIYADPPWRYNFTPTKSRAIENQYPTLNVADIVKLPVQPMFAANAILFLWATAPKLREALEVLDGWGFQYKTHAVWDKEKIGMGYWFRGQHELLLVGTRGTCSPPAESDRVPSVFRERRTARHSQKPRLIYEWIEKWFPRPCYLELFGRERYSPRWTVWGFEAPQ